MGFRLAFIFTALLALAFGCEKQPPAPSSGPSPASESGSLGLGPELLRERADRLLGFFREPKRSELATVFSSSFLKDITPEKALEPFQHFSQRYGKPERVRLLEMAEANAARVEFAFARARLPAQLTLDPAPPHKICGLFFGELKTDADTLEALLAELKSLPGKKGALLRRLEPRPESLLELNPDEAFAIGSAFKLFLLATAAEEVASGQRRWTDVTALKDEWKSLPSGMLQDWPAGSPLTLHTLAALMASRSDNTAADHLFFTLGRDALEAALPKFGVSAASKNRPMLATRELFKLKLVLPEQALAQFAAADEAGRRKLLAEVVAKTPLREPRLATAPCRIEQVEWFASPSDLVRLLDRLRQPRHKDAAELLAVLPPFRFDEERWRFLGFKGGSEFGVACSTLLLQSGVGTWYALAIAWNDSTQAVDDFRLLGYAERLVRILQRREEAETRK